MACDFRIMARENGRIALSEIRYGLTPTALLSGRLREISSDPSLVKEMLLRGKTLKAEEALSGRFVDRLVSLENLNEETLREARLLCRQAPSAYAAVKKAMRAWNLEERLWKESLEDFKMQFETPEATEGVAAMRDKRRPRWED
jgi:enoyl-CoA hydratase